MKTFSNTFKLINNNKVESWAEIIIKKQNNELRINIFNDKSLLIEILNHPAVLINAKNKKRSFDSIIIIDSFTLLLNIIMKCQSKHGMRALISNLASKLKCYLNSLLYNWIIYIY